MAEAKGLSKPVKLKSDLAAFLGETELPRTEITQKLQKDLLSSFKNGDYVEAR